MPSERRLHPLSIPFWLGGQIRRAILPLVFGAASASFIEQFSVWQVVLLGFIPITVASVVRYFTFRYRYEAGELVIRSGLIFRRERHVPYGRIQNLDAVQGVFHRVLGVVEVKIQTGGGQEPEATMTVLPLEALSELRERVFADRAIEEEAEGGLVESLGAGGDAPEATQVEAGLAATPMHAAPDLVSDGAEGETLLHLSPRELIIYGLIQNRGMIVIAAAFGIAWEVGVMDRITGALFGDGSWFERLVGEVTGFSGSTVLASIAVISLGVAVLAIFARLLSMAWALVRLYDYRIVRADEDLRTTFGLLTQVAATIPMRRIQTVTIHETPLHRWAKRVAVAVETAGGTGGEADPLKQWLAPIVLRDRLEPFLAEVVPELDLPGADWQPVAERAAGRIFRLMAVPATGVSIPGYIFLGYWGVAIHAALLVWARFYAGRYAKSLGWAVDGETVLFRSGWLWRRMTVARFAKIQVVTVHSTPFDRRREMARVRVDSAGATAASHKVDIPYLPTQTAVELGDRLATAAARTAFRW